MIDAVIISLLFGGLIGYAAGKWTTMLAIYEVYKRGILKVDREKYREFTGKEWTL